MTARADSLKHELQSLYREWSGDEGLLLIRASEADHAEVAELVKQMPLEMVFQHLSINELYRRQTGVRLGFRHVWVSFALLVSAPLVMGRILLRREVDWRGRRYSLDAASRLATPMRPPCRSTMDLAIHNPSPSPRGPGSSSAER